MDISVHVELTADREWKLRLPPDAKIKDLPAEIQELAGFRRGADGRPRLPATSANLEILRRLLPHLKADPSLLLRDLLDALEARKYTISTRRLYLHYNRKFLLLTGLTPDNVAAADLRRYLGDFMSRAVSRSTQGLMHSALRFYYETIRGGDLFPEIGRPRPDPRQPLILKRTEVKRILEAGDDAMYRAVLALIYSGGLRSGEAAVLRREDILRYDGLIRVGGPGDRPERFTPLSETALDALDEYLADVRGPMESGGFIFPAPRGPGAISPRSIERAFHRAREIAGVKFAPGVHALRHAFAAHALEDGESRERVAAWMGFKTVRSLRPYLP